MQADRGLLYYEVSMGNNDASRFNKFIANLLKLLVFQTKSHVLIMDNSRIHKPTELREIIEDGRIHHQLKFLPPYSPQLNPIEIMFSSWKAAIKNIEMNRDVMDADLKRYIEEASATVKSETKAKGWYSHVMKYYTKCALGEPLDEKYNTNTLASLI